MLSLFLRGCLLHALALGHARALAAGGDDPCRVAALTAAVAAGGLAEAGSLAASAVAASPACEAELARAYAEEVDARLAPGGGGFIRSIIDHHKTHADVRSLGQDPLPECFLKVR